MIKLPNTDWFMGLMKFRGPGNVFTGSFGTDPYYGCMNRKIFRYRLWIEKNDSDEFILKAICYTGENSYDETDKDVISENTFEASDDGIKNAGEWIESLYKSQEMSE